MTALLKQFGTWFAIMACVLVPAFAGSESTENVMISKTGETAGAFLLTVEMPKRLYQVGAPIPLTVRLMNMGQKEVQLRQSTVYTMYDITVRDEDGTEMPKTRFGQKQAWGAAFPKGFIRLTPGQEHSVSLPISRLFDMTLAGKYTIAVSKAIATRDSDKVRVSAPSLTASVVEE